MKTCGGCTLCCKIAKVPELNKPSNQWCQHCAIGVGCRTYDDRPKVCSEFTCHWLASDMPDEERPDRVGFYISMEGNVAKVHGHPAGAVANKVIRRLRAEFHVLVLDRNHLTFLNGYKLQAPEKLMLDWTL
jgi:hypothetical protein